MPEVVPQGQGAPNHQVLHISGVLRSKAFGLWCRLTKLAFVCVCCCAVTALSLPLPPAMQTRSLCRGEDAVARRAHFGGWLHRF